MSIPKRGWILYEQETAKRVWNPAKNRHETWVRHPGKDWLLIKGEPINIDEDDFISPSITTWVSLYGLNSELQWWVTGRPNPSGANFAQLNELGGGLLIKTRPTNVRWIAIHYGNIFPFNMSLSPHMYLRTTAEQLTSIHRIWGLIGSSGKPSTGSTYSEPDDGIYMRFDTNIDAVNMYSVTRAGGSETAKSLASADLEHHNYCIRVNDDGDEAEFLRDGVILTTHTSGEDLPTGVALQPYYAVMTRTNAVREIHLHHYIGLFDALWI